MYLSSEGPGQEVTPYTLYSAEIGDETLKLTKRPFKMAKEKPAKNSIGYTFSGYPSKTQTTQKEKITNDTKSKTNITYDTKYPTYDNLDTLESAYPLETMSEIPEYPEYEEITDTINMFFGELEYNADPNIHWYLSAIKEQLESAQKRMENKFMKEMSRTQELPTNNHNAV